MSNDYKYKGLPFTEAIAEKLLNDLSGQEFLINQTGEILLQHHLDQEGSPPEAELPEIVLGAFHLLSANGRARGLWIAHFGDTLKCITHSKTSQMKHS